MDMVETRWVKLSSLSVTKSITLWLMRKIDPLSPNSHALQLIIDNIVTIGKTGWLMLKRTYQNCVNWLLVLLVGGDLTQMFDPFVQDVTLGGGLRICSQSARHTGTSQGGPLQPPMSSVLITLGSVFLQYKYIGATGVCRQLLCGPSLLECLLSLFGGNNK